MPRLARIVIALLLLATLAGPAAGHPSSATPASSPTTGHAPHDLAAMALTSADLAAVGLAGHGIGFGETRSPDTVAAAFAAIQDRPVPEVREALVAAGLGRTYIMTLDRPTTPDDPSSPIARQVLSYIYEVADADGAAAAFELLEDESASDTAADIPGTGTIGDASEVTRDQGEDQATGAPYQVLDLGFRRGNLLAGVSVFDFANRPPPVAEVEALAARQLARIEAVRAGGAPGLGTRVLRLAGEGVTAGRDYYELRDGQVNPPYPNHAAHRDAVTWAEGVTAAGITDRFVLNQQITTADGASAAYGSTLLRFADEAAASTYIRRTLTRDAAFQKVADAPVFGDESLAYAFAPAAAAGTTTTTFRSYAVRVGADAAYLDLGGLTSPSPAAIEALAAAQTACLETGACPDSLPLPPALVAVGTPAATPDTASPAAAPLAAAEALDLAAMLPTPADLATAGLAGYGLARGGSLPSSCGATDVALARERAHVAEFVLPTNPGDPTSPPLGTVFSFVWARADRERATLAFAASRAD